MLNPGFDCILNLRGAVLGVGVCLGLSSWTLVAVIIVSVDNDEQAIYDALVGNDHRPSAPVSSFAHDYDDEHCAGRF